MAWCGGPQVLRAGCIVQGDAPHHGRFVELSTLGKPNFRVVQENVFANLRSGLHTTGCEKWCGVDSVYREFDVAAHLVGDFSPCSQ